MLYKLGVSALLLLCATSASAQTNETIRTGRPGQAIGAYVVGTGYFQVQSGFDHARSESLGASQDTDIFSNVLRYGTTERFEVSGVFNFQQDKFSNTTTADRSGFSEFQLGFRYNLSERPDGLIPGIGIQTRFRFTNTASQYRTNQVAPIVVVATNHKLSDSVALAHNIGIAYDGVSAIPKYSLISNLSFPIEGRLGGFAEIYGDVKDNLGAIYLDAGAAYLIGDDLQLDTYAGWGNNRGNSEMFLSVGLSWRVQTLRTRGTN